jgi:hypothetical protein
MAHIFDLYIDESGGFQETQNSTNNQGFASQLVGILAPQGQLTSAKAEGILETCYRNAGYSQLGKEVHGTKLSPGTGFDRLIATLAEKITERGWQPVRLVNQEGINYGDRTANYVNMVAELVLRIFQQKSLEGCSQIMIDLHYATVYLGSNSQGNPNYLDEEFYRHELEYYLAFAAVRQGLADKYSRWKIGKYRYRSAKKERELQLCDLLSNASHNDYNKCGEEAKNILQNAFKPCEYSMIAYLVLEQCDLFIQNGSLGLAIRTIAERLIQEDKGGDVREGALLRLESILDKLAVWTTTATNTQLILLTNWLELIINVQRSLDLGSQLVRWLRIQVYEPLVARLGDKKYTLDWFNYTLHFWALTACNHQGNLIAGREEADRLEKLISALAGQWEYVTLLMEGLVAEGVHRIDCWEYDVVATKMKLVADYYREVSSLFSVAFPDVFPEKIRSELRGKALGTWLQAEIYAGATRSTRLNKARELSDLCLVEFTTPGDKARQYQYRCHLETLAGNFAIAREYLAKNFELEDNSHNALARYITTLEDFYQGFALLHWLRLGTIAYLDNNHSEWQEFSIALKQFKLSNNLWCKGQQSTHYPTHGILRRIALIDAIEGKQDFVALGTLRNLTSIERGNLVLGLIQCAAYAEVASFCWENNNTMARKILDCQEPDRLGLQQLLEILTNKSRNLFPKVEQLTLSWLKIIGEILTTNLDRAEVSKNLLKMGREVSY